MKPRALQHAQPWRMLLWCCMHSAPATIASSSSSIGYVLLFKRENKIIINVGERKCKERESTFSFSALSLSFSLFVFVRLNPLGPFFYFLFFLWSTTVGPQHGKLRNAVLCCTGAKEGSHKRKHARAPPSHCTI